MTGKDSADGLFEDIAAAWAKAFHNVANDFFDGCGFAHAGANVQWFENVGDGSGTDYASAFGPILSWRTAHAGSATTQRSRRFKEERQSKGEEEGES